MPTARLLSGRPVNRDLGDRRMVLTERLRVDLGVWYPELWEWAQTLPTTARVDMFRVEHEDGPDTTGVVVYEGFVHDGSSFPDGWPIVGWLARVVVGAKELRLVSGILHDALYRWQAPRDVSDEVWWRVARSGDRHVRRVGGWFGWAGLRVGAWRAYRRYA